MAAQGNPDAIRKAWQLRTGWSYLTETAAFGAAQ